MSFDFSSRVLASSDVVRTTGLTKINGLVSDVQTACNSLESTFNSHTHSSGTGSVAITICTSVTRPSSAAVGEIIVETDTGLIRKCTSATGPTWGIVNVVTICTSSTQPTVDLVAGQLIFETDTSLLKYYSGSAWVALASDYITLPEQSSAPSTAANSGAVYTKETATVTELWYREESDGTEVQVTSLGGLVKKRGFSSFVASGTFIQGTDCPADVFVVRVRLWGGGGGGGGSTSGGAGGGGGGGYSEKLVTLTDGESVTVTLGAGGAGGSGAVSGSNGGTSSFGAHLSASGGTGGTYSTSNGVSAGGAGGSGADGDINIDGQRGADNQAATDPGSAGGGSPKGGSGGLADRTDATSRDGCGPGGGGSGSLGSGTGGEGTDGLVEVIW